MSNVHRVVPQIFFPENICFEHLHQYTLESNLTSKGYMTVNLHRKLTSKPIIANTLGYLIDSNVYRRTGNIFCGRFYSLNVSAYKIGHFPSRLACMKSILYRELCLLEKTQGCYPKTVRNLWWG